MVNNVRRATLMYDGVVCSVKHFEKCRRLCLVIYHATVRLWKYMLLQYLRKNINIKIFSGCGFLNLVLYGQK